jgi:hypothetical protein
MAADLSGPGPRGGHGSPISGSTRREIATERQDVLVERRPTSAALLQVAYPCLERTEAVHDAPESLLLAVDLYLAGKNGTTT